MAYIWDLYDALSLKLILKYVILCHDNNFIAYENIIITYYKCLISLRVYLFLYFYIYIYIHTNVFSIPILVVKLAL